MSEYWMGVLTLPAVAVLMAIAAATVFGSWLLFEKWAEGRIVKLPPVKVTKKLDKPGRSKIQLRSLTQTGGRGVFAALLLTVDKAAFFKIGPNTGIGIVYGKPNDDQRASLIREALDKTLHEMAKERDDDGCGED